MSNPITKYHEQLEAMRGLNSDHFQSPVYSRGAVRRVEPRSKRTSIKRIAWRVLLAMVFFGLFGFVFLVGMLRG